MNQEHISILLVDDEERIRETFGEILILNGFAVVPAEDGKAAVSAFCKERPSVVLLDMNLPDRSGMDVLREMQRIDRSVPIIFVTAYGDIPSAVDAIKEGAYDFIAKPPDFDRLLLTIRRAMEKRQLEQAVTDLSAAYRTSLESMLGASASMQPVIRQLKDIAVSDYSVILQG
ncbi:MAG TPA: response regulator, partial [Dissulfurispiraceae bacterium]|nr:response regulator [Dissulfurispiraceae bacterium]